MSMKTIPKENGKNHKENMKNNKISRVFQDIFIISLLVLAIFVCPDVLEKYSQKISSENYSINYSKKQSSEVSYDYNI